MQFKQMLRRNNFKKEGSCKESFDRGMEVPSRTFPKIVKIYFQTKKKTELKMSWFSKLEKMISSKRRLSCSQKDTLKKKNNGS